MTLTYHWEDMIINEPYSTRTISPHTHEVVRDVDYDFDVRITIEDVIDYLTPPRVDRKEQTNAKFYMDKIFHFLIESNTIDGIDLDALEDDESFVEYLKEKYEEDALEAFAEENEAY